VMLEDPNLKVLSWLRLTYNGVCQIGGSHHPEFVEQDAGP